MSRLVGFILALGASVSESSSSSSFLISTSSRGASIGSMSSPSGARSLFSIFVGLTSALRCPIHFPAADEFVFGTNSPFERSVSSSPSQCYCVQDETAVIRQLLFHFESLRLSAESRAGVLCQPEHLERMYTFQTGDTDEKSENSDGQAVKGKCRGCPIHCAGDTGRLPKCRRCGTESQSWPHP